MTVDSEAIFALLDDSPGPETLEELYGAMATAWIDERRPDELFLARGVGRPLWLGQGRRETFFASTKHALELIERYLDLRLSKREVPEGSYSRSAPTATSSGRRSAPSTTSRTSRCRPSALPRSASRACASSPRRRRGVSLDQRPVRRYVDALVDELLAHEELKRRPGAAAALEHAGRSATR